MNVERSRSEKLFTSAMEEFCGELIQTVGAPVAALERRQVGVFLAGSIYRSVSFATPASVWSSPLSSWTSRGTSE